MDVGEVIRFSAILNKLSNNWICFLIVVNPQARSDLWIISDFDCSDRMYRFHKIKEISKSEDSYAAWYMFKHFDIFTHTATSSGLQLTQIINAMISMLNTYRRLPAKVIILMSERLMMDRLLQQTHLKEVLAGLCRQVIRAIEIWMDKVPSKVLPKDKTQIYITKPLPKPEVFYDSAMDLFRKFATIRRNYNSTLVATVKRFGIGFINVGINQDDGQYFKRTTHANRFDLTDKGLLAYWEGINNALEKLAENRTIPGQQFRQASTQTFGPIGTRNQKNFKKHNPQWTSFKNKTK